MSGTALLGALEALLAGVWLGGYLFTTFVVTPALKSLPLRDAERIRTRSVIGRRYGRLAAPLLLIWLGVLFMEGWLQGFEPWTFVRLGLLAVLAGTVGVHGAYVGRRLDALAAREVAGEAGAAAVRVSLQRLSARLTPVSLAASLALAVSALFR